MVLPKWTDKELAAMQAKWDDRTAKKRPRLKPRQALYGERHKEDLRKAWQVVSALMRLRTREWSDEFVSIPVAEVAESLQAFLTETERSELLKQILESFFTDAKLAELFKEWSVKLRSKKFRRRSKFKAR